MKGCPTTSFEKIVKIRATRGSARGEKRDPLVLPGPTSELDRLNIVRSNDRIEYDRRSTVIDDCCRSVVGSDVPVDFARYGVLLCFVPVSDGVNAAAGRAAYCHRLEIKVELRNIRGVVAGVLQFENDRTPCRSLDIYNLKVWGGSPEEGSQRQDPSPDHPQHCHQEGPKRNSHFEPSDGRFCLGLGRHEPILPSTL